MTVAELLDALGRAPRSATVHLPANWVSSRPLLEKVVIETTELNGESKVYLKSH